MTGVTEIQMETKASHIDAHTHGHTLHKISKTLISIFTVRLLFHILSLSLSLPLPPGQGRRGKVVVFQARYYPLTQTADRAEPSR